MDIPEVIFPGSQDRSQLQRRFDTNTAGGGGTSGQGQHVNINVAHTGHPGHNDNTGHQAPAPGQGPARPKVPNIYVKKPHRKQPALGLFLAKADPEDREDWRLKSGKTQNC